MIIEKQEDEFHVADMILKEHKERSMLDGQIQDVPSVANIIRDIKQELEAKHGPLTKVCVAAAGRALRTETARADLQVAGKPMLTKEDVRHLELTAVQKAQSLAAEKQQLDQNRHYYCVGYSVLYYRLDDEEIKSLIDQQGQVASVEIIATFLPRVVVESLIAALNRTGLEIEALTLEPIAAIHVLVPPSMRRLNIALVDIGAGTSDIAITREGTVISYGMVPVAGDEMTEALSDQFLLDFPVAEQLKRELQTADEVTMTDVLGFETTLSKKDVTAKMEGAVQRLAEAIQQEIYQLNNNKAPQAVMLVGGGSLTPGLVSLLAEKLQLPENRVAIRGTDAIKGLAMADHLTHAPTLVTPIGIAIAAKQQPIQYKTVYVNDQPVRLFELHPLTAGDCLLAAGLKLTQLYGKPGLAMMVTFNDQLLTIPGEYGHPPALTKNGQPCGFDELVQDGDKLAAVKGEDGQSPAVMLSDLLEEETRISLHLQKELVEVPMTIRVNEEAASPDTALADGDVIEARFPTIAECLELHHKQQWLQDALPFYIVLNHKKTYFPSLSGKILINGKEEKLSKPVQKDWTIEWIPAPKRSVAMIASIKQYALERSIRVLFSGKEVTLTKRIARCYRNGIELEPDDLVSSGEEIIIETAPQQDFIFQDLFRHVEVTIPDGAGTSFRLLKNGEDTAFYDTIQPGDELNIQWEIKKPIQ
nr:cell division protein FtsA [Bacillus xiapuensis]